MLRHLYATPTFKTNTLCLVNDEGRVKRLLVLYKRQIQPSLTLLWLVSHFVIPTRTTHPLLKLKRSILLVMKDG